ncbi:MAG: acyltransferase [Candidatus Thorarchaeota archaeon]
MKGEKFLFQPASLKGESPVPIDEKLRNRFLFFYILIIIISFIPGILFEYYFIAVIWIQSKLYWVFFLLLPFNMVFLIYLTQISATIIAALFIKIVNLIHKPKEGTFKRSINDKDYLFWNLRNMIKKWPLYITTSNPFPWFKNRFTLRFFGVKIGKHCICDNSWISSEFVSIGNNVILGMNATLISFGIEQEYFIIKKIIIEDNVLIGAKCVLLPGTHIKCNCKLEAHSYTNHNDILKENSLYSGHPAKLKQT